MSAENGRDPERPVELQALFLDGPSLVVVAVHVLLMLGFLVSLYSGFLTR